MKESIKTVFTCDHCKRKMFVKSACLRHELVCSKNPVNNIACIGCDNCTEVKKTIYIDSYHGEYEREVKSFSCSKLNVDMYPPKALNIVAKFPESFDDEILMPSQCVHFSNDKQLPW